MMTETEERYERLLADVCHERDRLHGIYHIAVREIDRLREALQRVVDDVNDYERVNNLAPKPGRTECWDSVAHAKNVLARLPDDT